MDNHKVYLKMCQDFSSISKCAKHKVGALLVKNNRIISNGLNGSPSGFENCSCKFKNVDMSTEPGRTAHRVWSETYEIHAEMNAILKASKNGVNIDQSILYCNLEPCFNCLKHAIAAGIKEIYYAKKHKQNLDSPEALMLKDKLGIKIEHIEV